MDTPPKTGLYVSETNPNVRLVVEDVGVVDDEAESETSGFFLVEVVKEEDAGDTTAPGDELDPDEWSDLVSRFSLKFAEET